MAWHGILGHDRIAAQFQQAVARGRLASTFLFVGPDGVGKKAFALRLAQALLCEANSAQALAACGTCPACVQVAASSHPDLYFIEKPPNKSFIPVELFVGDSDHRMREGLCHKIALKPFRGGRKIAVIDDADFMNQEGANCLLKTLEEPPPKSVIMLIASNEQRQLPTVRSRCQVVRFQPLDDDTVVKLLIDKNLVDDPQQAKQLAELAGGSIAQALAMADPAVREFREQLLQQLVSIDDRRLAFLKDLTAFIDAAGKEAAVKRARMRLVMQTAAEFYRQLMHALCGGETTSDSLMKTTVAAACANWPADAEAAANCIQRCLDAELHVLSNANQATVLECWIDDLAELTRSDVIVVS